MSRHAHQRLRGGFTLLEALVAVSIAATVAAWLIPTALRLGAEPARREARIHARQWLSTARNTATLRQPGRWPIAALPGCDAVVESLQTTPDHRDQAYAFAYQWLRVQVVSRAQQGDDARVLASTLFAVPVVLTPPTTPVLPNPDDRP